MNISDKWIIKWYYENIEKSNVMKVLFILSLMKD